MTALFLGTAGTAIAGGSVHSDSTETDPYCELERNGSSRDYPGIGWTNDVGTIPADQPVGPAKFTACEGEHWDGQDTVRPNDNNAGSCTGQTVDLANDAYNVAVFECSDPGRYSDLELAQLVGARFSAQGDKTDANNGAAYLAVRISGVGDAVIFAGGCLAGGEEFGHATGGMACQGDLGHGVLGIYLQDNTPLGTNVLASAVSAARLTKGYVAEGDCAQGPDQNPGTEKDDDPSTWDTTYEESARRANAGHEPTCGRDNTAITIELLA